MSLEKIFKYQKKYYTKKLQTMSYEEQIEYFKSCEIREKAAKQTAEQGELCAELRHIFPQTKEDVEKIIFSGIYKDGKPKSDRIYTVDYLPLHLHDDEWLMNYVATVMQMNRPNCKVLNRAIRYFIKKSTAFQKCRADFERLVTGVQAKYMITTAVPNALMKNTLPTAFMLKNENNYDVKFRQEVINVMTANGASVENVEQALEEHADVWRKKTMIIAFENEYYPLIDIVHDNEKASGWWKRLAKVKQGHQAVWLKRREYDYYQQHKELIDQLGLATPNMKINKYQLKHLDTKLSLYEKAHDVILGIKRTKLKNCMLKGLKADQTQINDQNMSK